MLLPISLRGCAALAALALPMLLAALPAQAQTPRAAVFEDTMAQRVLACVGCHGAEGRAAPDGFYPRIAGKPAGYLFHQLLNFRDGRRHYALMTHLVAPLTDAYLAEIAAHFAQLDLPYPPPAAPPSPAVAARGEALVLRGDPARGIPACVACHGEQLTGLAPAIPGLLGLPRDYLNAQFGAWRTGKRRAHAPDCMREIAEKLSLDDVDALSRWLASRRVPQPAHAATSLPQPLPIACGGVSERGGEGNGERSSKQNSGGSPR